MDIARQQLTLDAIRFALQLRLVSVTALCLFAGCSEPKFYPVRGKIVIFAVGPLTQGEIHFRPVSRPSLVATGQIQKDGSFTMSTPGHGEGVLEGDCQVEIIVDPGTGKRPIAERYGTYST